MRSSPPVLLESPRVDPSRGNIVTTLFARKTCLFGDVPIVIEPEGLAHLQPELQAKPNSGGNTTTTSVAQTEYTGRYAICQRSSAANSPRLRRKRA